MSWSLCCRAGATQDWPILTTLGLGQSREGKTVKTFPIWGINWCFKSDVFYLGRSKLSLVAFQTPQVANVSKMYSISMTRSHPDWRQWLHLKYKQSCVGLFSILMFRWHRILLQLHRDPVCHAACLQPQVWGGGASAGLAWRPRCH